MKLSYGSNLVSTGKMGPFHRCRIYREDVCNAFSLFMRFDMFFLLYPSNIGIIYHAHEPINAIRVGLTRNCSTSDSG